MTVKDRIRELVEAMPEPEAAHLLETLEARPNGAAHATNDKSLEEKITEIASRIPEEERRKVPPDLLDQLDHYIYGTPKR